jgi:hypothetical protein
MNNISDFTDNLFGRSRILSIAGESCVSCGKTAHTFRDELSRKEFDISGLAQCCQDKFFGEDMRDEG